MLATKFNFSQPVERLVHRDEVRLNHVRQLFIATMIGHVFDKGALLYKIYDWENYYVSIK